VVNYVEAAIVLDRDPDPLVGRKLDALRERAAITLVPVDERQAHLARAAYRDFGKGRVIPQSSISATVSPMRWPRPPASRCCTKAMISPTPTPATRCLDESHPANSGTLQTSSWPGHPGPRESAAGV
jgi:hypothetical protein